MPKYTKCQCVVLYKNITERVLTKDSAFYEVDGILPFREETTNNGAGIFQTKQKPHLYSDIFASILAFCLFFFFYNMFKGD